MLRHIVSKNMLPDSEELSYSQQYQMVPLEIC